MDNHFHEEDDDQKRRHLLFFEWPAREGSDNSWIRELWEAFRWRDWSSGTAHVATRRSSTGYLQLA